MQPDHQHHPQRMNGAEHPLASDPTFHLGRQSAQIEELFSRIERIETSIAALFKRRIHLPLRDLMPAFWGLALLLLVLAGKVTLPVALAMLMGRGG